MQRAGFLLWILICGVLVFDIGIACVRAQDSSSRIKTREVDIVNAGGMTVMEITNTDTGPTIDMCDVNGHTRMNPGADEDGGSIDFFDAKINSIALLSCIEDKDDVTDTLGIHTPGQASINLAATGSDYNGLTILDKSNHERASIGYSPKGDVSGFAAEAASSQSGIFAGVYGKNPHVLFHDPKGTPRVDFGVDLNNNAYFALAGQDGTAAWQKTFDPNGTATAIGGNSSGSGDDSGSGSVQHALKQHNDN